MSAPRWLTESPVAHRGLHMASAGTIENTVSAARAAAEAGFAIECDVQLTRDGEAVVFHDFTLDRLTDGTGRLDGRTAAELAAIPFRVTGDRIPTLGTFLDTIGGRVPLFIEIKSRFDGDHALARRVAAILSGRSDPVAIMSFDETIVEALDTLAPDRPHGIVAMDDYSGREWDTIPPERKRSLAGLLHVGRTKPDFLAWHVKALPHAVPNLARYFGLPVLTWTVRTAADREKAAAYADQTIFEGFDPRARPIGP